LRCATPSPTTSDAGRPRWQALAELLRREANQAKAAPEQALLRTLTEVRDA
jgi:hypothetical protein